ncbi:MAG: hypothetical protein ACKVU1_12365 [bacterium]
MIAALLVAIAIAALLPGRIAFFALPPLALLPRFIAHVRAGRHGAAARDALVWALALSILTILVVLVFPERMESRVAHGPAYRDETFRWIETGVGKEGNIREFLPEHLLHLCVLLVLSFATGGIAALYLGGFLLGYMNFYVASLIAVSNAPALSALVGWPVWSVCRVTGFVLAAVAVARPAYRRFRSAGADLATGRRFLAAGLGLAVVDILLKHFLAETWRGFLRHGLTG